MTIMNKNYKLKLAIIGHGFVGQATDFGFSLNVDKFIVDPLRDTSVEDLIRFKPDIAFVCVPTPMMDNGGQDSSIIENVLEELNTTTPDVIKVVKSTVLPSVLTKLKKLDHKLIYNPEFLRENNAQQDFINSAMIILGGEEKTAKIVSEAYLNHSRCKTKDHIFTDLETASFIKYSINTFLASKVIFFNELYSLFGELCVNDDWGKVIKTISLDTRIGNSHMHVPGHDGRKGFGGACFPKDTSAFIKYADEAGVNLKLLKSVVKTNNKIRSKYKEVNSRESEQNISFDDKI